MRKIVRTKRHYTKFVESEFKLFDKKKTKNKANQYQTYSHLRRNLNNYMKLLHLNMLPKHYTKKKEGKDYFYDTLILIHKRKREFDAKNGIESYLSWMHTFIESLLHTYNNYRHKNGEKLAALPHLRGMINYLESLRIAYCRAPKKKLNELCCSYANFINIILIPEDDEYFKKMSTEVIEIIKAFCNTSNAPQFETIPYTRKI